VTANLEMTKGLIFAEFVLEALVKKGVARFDAYRDIQRVAFAALESGEHFLDAVSNDESIATRLTRKEIAAIFKPKNHLAASDKIIYNVAKLVREKCRR